MFREQGIQLLPVHHFNVVRLEYGYQEIRELLGTRPGNLPERHLLPLECGSSAGRVVDRYRYFRRADADDLCAARKSRREKSQKYSRCDIRENGRGR